MPQEIEQKIIKNARDKKLIEQSLCLLKKHLQESDENLAHSLRTALFLQKMKAEDKMIAAGLLHHILPTEISLDNEVKTIVRKVYQLRDLSSYENDFKPTPIKKWQQHMLSEQAENLRKMFFAVAQDVRPIFVSLAGRLDEMLNMVPNYSKDTQRKKSAAALEILAPVAYGLGIGDMKGRFEDSAFKYLYPKEYNWLKENVKEKYTDRQKHAEETRPRLEEILNRAKIDFINIDARAKRQFSLYQKLFRHNMDIDKIYDLSALRIIVKDIAACYAALGAVHNVYKPVYGRIKDYISSPKPNGYRSLHSTVACPECGRFIEVQIKTAEMHQEAEYGAVAHLSYKEEIAAKTYRHQFYWMEKIRKWQEEIKDQEKIAEHLQNDLFKNQVFVFTPKKDIINLAKGATPVDLAYAVHSEIGDHCAGAKINGKMASLKEQLKTGDAVNIITDKNKAPTADWLRFVKTHKAKQRINNFLEKAHGISLAKPEKRRKPSLKGIKEKISALRRILPLKKGPQILIGGQTGISVKMAKCCAPSANDKLQAFITKGQGASVHKAHCPNLKELQQKWPQRLVPATWKGA